MRGQGIDTSYEIHRHAATFFDQTINAEATGVDQVMNDKLTRVIAAVTMISHTYEDARDAQTLGAGCSPRKIAAFRRANSSKLVGRRPMSSSNTG